MNPFNFKIPQNIIFGMGSLAQLPELLIESSSNHVFLISDGGLAKLGVVEKIESIIQNSGITCTTYLGVLPNPTVSIVRRSNCFIHTVWRHLHCSAGW